MQTSETKSQIEAWLEGLSHEESKRREAIALAIMKTPTYDERIVAALKQIAQSDPKDYARNAAVRALQKIAEAHFLAGNDIRAYLEKWRAGDLPRARPQETPRQPIAPASIQSESKPVAPMQTAPELQAAAFQPLPKQTEPESTRVVEPAAPAPRVHPVTPSPVHPIAPSPAPQPPTPAVPFDQWLLSERNIKLALYSGGFLLILAGLIFVGVNWNYLPGIAKLGVTFAVTLSMYVGGVLLYKRPTLKIGGAALLAIASGFLPLNFVVTQIYLTGGTLSNNAMWFFASLVCGIVYALTALWARHNLFTVFAVVAAYSGATALKGSDLQAAGFAFPYALVTLVILLVSIGARNVSRVSFTSRTLRISAHLAAPIVFLIAVAEWFLSSTNFYRSNSALALAAMFLLVILYVVDDWRSKAVYARWGSSFVFGVFAALLCTELRLSSIQTGLVLKILAAVYLLLGKFLQRGNKLIAGLPLYLVAGLLAALVTMQSLVVYTRTPEHLALALVGDVVLLAIAAYLFRRVEFVYGAAWLALAPMFIYSSIYLQTMTQRGIAFGVMLLVYAAVAYYFAPRHLQWVTPFLSVAAFLSVLVPAMFIPEFSLVTLALVVIAALYAVMAVRLQMPPLLLASIAAVSLAIASGARIFYPSNIELARVVAFGLCAWAVILFYARRGLQYLRLNEWAQPLHFGALANFGMTYAFLAFIALDDMYRHGFVSPTFGLTLVWSVALLALTAYLYRRVEFVYAATWLAIAPTYIFARAYLLESIGPGLALGTLLLAYTAVGFVFARNRKWTLPFLSAAVFLSVVAPALLYREYPILMGLLLGIALLYGVMAVRLQFPFLVFGTLAALDLAIVAGTRVFYGEPLDVARASAILFAVIAVAWFMTQRVMQQRGRGEWARVFGIGEIVNLGLTYSLAFAITWFDGRGDLISPTLARTLVADVALLALTAYLHRRVEFVYAAAWLFIAPTYIFARLYLQDSVRVGLVLSALMLAYAAVGYFIGKVRFKWSGAFLSAAVTLSVIVVGVLYPNYAVMTAVLVGIGFLYAFFAVWLRWRWLTLAALAALNLALFTGMLSVFTLNIEILRASAIGYAALGVALVAGGVELKRRGWLNWRAPLYLVGAFDLLLALALAAQSNTNALIAVISFVIALVAFAMEWVEREAMQRIKASSTLVYVGAFAALLGIFSTLRALNLPIEYAPTAIALGSALYIGGALLLSGGELSKLYGEPLRYVGWFGMGCALLASLVLNKPLAGAFTFGIAAIAFAADGLVRKQIAFVYASGASVVVTIWYALFYFRVTEWQAFAIPLGAWCLAVGWSELRRGKMQLYQAATLAGFAILFGSAFYQSLTNINYALLLLVESAVAFGIGWRFKSRAYVSAAILAIVANGLAQFGPAFVNLDRWIQIGTIGSILLLGGLVGLLRREKLLQARRAFTSEWKAWKP